jgi:hypothetical protein
MVVSGTGLNVLNADIEQGGSTARARRFLK